MEKECCKCGIMKPLTEYTKQKGGRFGAMSNCKPCAAEVLRDRRKTPLGKAKAAARTDAYWARMLKSNPALYLWHNAKNRAKAAGIAFSITPDDIIVNRACPVLGLVMNQEREKRGSGGGMGRDLSMSLDKIIPELGYVPGNVAVISFRANRLKNDSSLAEIEALASWLRVADASARAPAFPPEIIWRLRLTNWLFPRSPLRLLM